MSWAGVGTALVRHRGNFVWDGIVRGSAVLAVLGIGIELLASSAAGGLVGFVVVTIWVNGPLGIFLPATYEPILMLFGRLYPPVLIGFLGILGTLYVEFLNYHLYARVLHLRGFSPARESALVQRVVKLFNRAPFFTVWLCSWSPLPYWTVRIVAPLADYSLRRYLIATFLGRFPRLWFFAALGLYWNVSAGVLGLIAAGSIVVTVAVWVVKGRMLWAKKQRGAEPKAAAR
jgi:uncharacterized membrane protein YdjX (TVP38/TMEM64 family)